MSKKMPRLNFNNLFIALVMLYKALHSQLQITSMKYINLISSHEKMCKNYKSKVTHSFQLNKNNTTDKRHLKPMLTPFKTPVTHVVDSNPKCQRGIFYSTHRLQDLYSKIRRAILCTGLRLSFTCFGNLWSIFLHINIKLRRSLVSIVLEIKRTNIYNLATSKIEVKFCFPVSLSAPLLFSCITRFHSS